MLLLAHHDRETIVLETSDGPIEVRLSRLDGAEPRIGIDAPKSVRIIRRELHEPLAEVAPAVPGIAAETKSTFDLDEDDWWHHPDDTGSADDGSAAPDALSLVGWDDERLD